MGLRSSVATFVLQKSRGFGRTLGCELVVDTSPHSIEVSMEVPDKSRRAWDANLFRHGQMYAKGYANPIKPMVNHNPELENPDTIAVDGGKIEEDEDETDVEDDPSPHVELISSTRYREYMRQDLISQLLNPREQWRLVVYAVIALALLMTINLMVSMAGAGIL